MNPTDSVVTDVCFYCGQPTTASDVIPVEPFDRESLPPQLRGMKLHLDAARRGDTFYAHSSCMARFTFKLLRNRDEEVEG